MILFGQEVSLPEAIGFVTGIAGVWLVMKQSIWNFPVGLVYVAASLILFYDHLLYSDVLQHAVYFVLLCYGWYQWGQKEGSGKREDRSRKIEAGSRKLEEGREMAVTASSSGLLLTLSVIAIAGSVTMGYLFGTYTNASYSYWDATGTTLSLIAQWMIARKKIENWLLWIAVNVLYIGIYYSKGLNLYVILYTMFLGMAVAGYYQWRKSLSPNPQCR